MDRSVVSVDFSIIDALSSAARCGVGQSEHSVLFRLCAIWLGGRLSGCQAETTYGQLSESTGMCKRNVIRIVSGLESRGIIRKWSTGQGIAFDVSPLLTSLRFDLEARNGLR